jgi:hypothetical protein
MKPDCQQCVAGMVNRCKTGLKLEPYWIEMFNGVVKVAHFELSRMNLRGILVFCPVQP